MCTMIFFTVVLNQSTKGKMFNDYGIDDGDLGPHYKSWVSAMDKHVHLIEVISGPALNSNVYPSYNYDHHEMDYYFYLTQGLHVSPSAGQDNHYKTWGRSTPARVGIFAESLEIESMLEAIKSYRTFATEDSAIELSFTINDEFMGSNISVVGENSLSIEVSYIDRENHQSAELMIVHGYINQENSSQASKVYPKDGIVHECPINSDEALLINDFVVGDDPQFLYVVIKQNDDNTAWSAPVWINWPVDATMYDLFFWTKSTSSQVYHQEGCSSVNLIKVENLESGTNPPAGRRLHSCNIINHDDH